MLPKSEFPWLTLNYNNFLPACAICNQRKQATPTFLTGWTWVGQDTKVQYLAAQLANCLDKVAPIEAAARATLLWPTSPVNEVQQLTWRLHFEGLPELGIREFIVGLERREWEDGEASFEADSLWDPRCYPMLHLRGLGVTIADADSTAILNAYMVHAVADGLNRAALSESPDGIRPPYHGTFEQAPNTAQWTRFYRVESALARLTLTCYSCASASDTGGMEIATVLSDRPRLGDESIALVLRQAMGISDGDAVFLVDSGIPTDIFIKVVSAFVFKTGQWHHRRVLPVRLLGEMLDTSDVRVKERGRTLIAGLKLNDTVRGKGSSPSFTDRRVYWRTKALFEAARTVLAYARATEQVQRESIRTAAIVRAPAIGHGSVWEAVFREYIALMPDGAWKNELVRLAAAVKGAFPGNQ